MYTGRVLGSYFCAHSLSGCDHMAVCLSTHAGAEMSITARAPVLVILIGREVVPVALEVAWSQSALAGQGMKRLQAS